jgi:hypothetical protein
MLEREEKLRRLLGTATSNAHVDRVVVADNGEASDRDLYHGDWGVDVDVLDLPFDAGIGACRAAVADELETEFLAVVDSDMEIPSNIETLVEILRRDPNLGAVSGILEENGRIRAGVTDFHEETLLDGREALVQGIREEKTVEWSHGYPVARFDKIPNALVARRACVEDYCWDRSIKDKDHLDWFLGHWQETDWEFAVTPSVIFRHHTNRSGDTEYHRKWRYGNEQRQNRWTEAVLDKHGYDTMIWGDSRWFASGRRPVSERVWKALAGEVPTKYSYPVKRAVERVIA